MGPHTEVKYIGGGWYLVIEYPLWPSKGIRHLSKVRGKKNLPISLLATMQ